jgi:hypothetical protein
MKGSLMRLPPADLQTLVLDPGQDASAARAALQAAGYRLTASHDLGQGDRSARTVWSSPGGDEITLIPDLVTGNVVLLLPTGLAVPPSLALATAEDGRRLLAEPEDRSILSGLQIAAALGDAALVPWLARHLTGPDPVIAVAAQRALAEIAGRSLAALDPDPGAALFSVPGWRAEKLQLLRLLALGKAEATGPLLALLARALADPDWEIAVTALLAVGRLGAGDLAPAAARVRLPDGKRDGVTAGEARFILALRDGVLAHLGWPRGRLLPPGIAEAVRGDAGGVPPAFAPLFCALTQPLPDPPAPFPPPDGIVQGESGPALSEGLLLVWVPPVAHWLGDAALTGRFAAPPRRHRPAAGFYVAAAPIGPMTYAEAEAELARMAQRTGLPIGLPDPDTWEMAARGPDGRRFAWGCSAAEEARIDLSPWGMAGACTGPGEWLGASSPGDRPWMAGGAALPIRAVRALCDPKESLLVRPIVRVR